MRKKADMVYKRSCDEHIGESTPSEPDSRSGEKIRDLGDIVDEREPDTTNHGADALC
jgi:hypothetical protein